MDVVRVQLHAQEATSRGLPVPGRRRRGPLASGRLERPRGGKHARLGHIRPPSLISAPEVCPSAGTSLRLEQTPGEGAPSSRGSVPPASCACWTLSPGDLGSSLWGPRRFCAGLRPHGSMMGNHGLTNPGLAGAMPTVRMAKATAAAEAAGKGTAKPPPSPRTAKRGSVFPGEAGRQASLATHAQKPWLLCREKGRKLTSLPPAAPEGPSHSSTGTDVATALADSESPAPCPRITRDAYILTPRGPTEHPGRPCQSR